jgi:hypothetical protein
MIVPQRHSGFIQRKKSCIIKSIDTCPRRRKRIPSTWDEDVAGKRRTKWLSEDQTSSAMNKDFFEWGTTEWFPKTIAAGWKYWAIIQPNHIISQIEHEKMAKDTARWGSKPAFLTQ